MEGCRININKPQLVQMPEMLVMGVEIRTTYARENNPGSAEMSKLWNRFLAEQLWLDVPVAVQPEIFYGVYTDYSHRYSDCTAIVAIEVSSIDNPPESMVGVTIPAGNYLVFTTKATPISVSKTWQQIGKYFCDTAYDRAYTTDFERHEPTGVSIHIAIK